LKNLFDVLYEAAEFSHSKTKVLFENEKLLWSDIFKEATKLAKIIVEQEISKRDHLIIEIDSGIDFLIALIAGIKLKLVIIPLSPDISDDEMNVAIELTKPKLLIKSSSVILSSERYGTVKQSLKEINLDGKRGFSLLSFDKRFSKTKNQELREICEEGAFVRFTSGTTGRAKGVLISFNKAYERIEVTKKNFSLNDTDVVLSLLPLPYHFVAALLAFISSGSSLIITKSLDDDFCKTQLDEVTVIYAAPYHYDYFCGSSRLEFNKLRLALSTSVKLQEKTYKNFLKKFKIPISQSYGVIEVGIPAANINSEIGEYDLIGKPFDDFKIFIGNDNLDEKNLEGVLSISGPGMFDDYLDPFILAKDILKNGKFVTGDIVESLNGKLKLIGRSSSVINVGGFKVFPEEVEEVLLQISEIKEVQVIGLVHDIFGNKLKAEIVLEENVVLSEKEIKNFCKKKLHPAKVPFEFEFVDKLKRNAAGKLFR